MTPRPGGIVLCGGQSRRMGQPKAWLPFGPERLLQRVVRQVGAAADPVVVVAAEGQDLPALPASVRVVRDAAANQGPLRGLATGLAALPDGVDLVYVAGTDAPFLEPAWVARLVALIEDHDLLIPERLDHLHPLAGLYRRGPVLAAAHDLLAQDRWRLTALLDRTRGRVVAADLLAAVDPGFETLRNLNTPDDYDRALRDAGFANNATG